MAIFECIFTTPGGKPISLESFMVSELPKALHAKGLTEIPSKSKIRRLIISGSIRDREQELRRPGWVLRPGTWLVARIDTELLFREKDLEDAAFEVTEDSILFEDECLLVINKPARFPSEATIVEGRDHALAAVKRYLHGKSAQINAPYAGLLHRLDRDTSGVLLFTKKREINAPIHRIFSERIAEKTYEALTAKSGRIPAFPFSLSSRIARISSKSQAGKWGSRKDEGDEALTDFELIKEYPGFLHVRACPHTGRTHQIRVHLSESGLPLLGDTLYGGPETINGHAVERGMLHARTLRFPHPLSGLTLEITAPFPQDFLALLIH